MKTIDFRSLAQFSPDKMQKHTIVETEQLTSELLCLDPGQNQRSHKNTTSDLVYFVLEGTGRFSIGRSTRELKAGMAALAPAGEEHGVVNMSDSRLLLLAVTAPPATGKP